MKKHVTLQEQKAFEACKALITAYGRGAAGGSIDWSEIDAAYALALEAVPSAAAAWAILEDFGEDELIEDLYNQQPALRRALSDLIPGFEYPDWASRTIGDVCDRVR